MVIAGAVAVAGVHVREIVLTGINGWEGVTAATAGVAVPLSVVCAACQRARRKSLWGRAGLKGGGRASGGGGVATTSCEAGVAPLGQLPTPGREERREGGPARKSMGEAGCRQRRRHLLRCRDRYRQPWGKGGCAGGSGSC